MVLILRQMWIFAALQLCCKLKGNYIGKTKLSQERPAVLHMARTFPRKSIWRPRVRTTGVATQMCEPVLHGNIEPRKTSDQYSVTMQHPNQYLLLSFLIMEGVLKRAGKRGMKIMSCVFSC